MRIWSERMKIRGSMMNWTSTDSDATEMVSTVMDLYILGALLMPSDRERPLQGAV